MGWFIKLCTFFAIVCFAYIAHKCLETPPLPKLENTWWGTGDPSKEDLTIKPFKIKVTDEVLKDLRLRLENTRTLTKSLEGTHHEYGINSNLLLKVIDFWRTKYNWRERELFLNQFPQYKVSIQGLNIHYLHVKPKKIENVRVLPLLLLHGWPGSVREFYELIPLLTTPREGYDFVFEVIAPSLPGFGFSDAAKRPGLGQTQMAVIFKNLMERLGFEKYYIQGGDWGATIAQSMSTLYPEKILGMHSNMCFASIITSELKMLAATILPFLIVRKEHEDKIYPRSKVFKFYMEETGYLHLQATKPDSVGYALNDSPVGLAAYILDKFIVFTNPKYRTEEDGGLSEKYSYTTLLDNVMIYWITGSISTSMRIYAESFNIEQLLLKVDLIPTKVPTACTRFSYELLYQPDAILRDKFHILAHSADYEGGHFPALELTRILADEVFLGILRIQSEKNS